MQNVILIGMPGAGKSTVGVVLAKKLGYAFVDADLVIQSREGRLLHEIISERGVEGFWQVYTCRFLLRISDSVWEIWMSGA